MPFDATPVETKPECQVLKEAAQLVRRGHCKRAPVIHVDGHKRYCAVGAIMVAANGSPAVTELGFRAAERLAALLFNARPGMACIGNITAWNDQPERTAEEVAQALEAAARP